MRILVCGGRNFDRPDIVAERLSKWHPTLIIQGGATGADNLAAVWASNAGVRVVTFYADWKAHGRAAGPIRNSKMLADGKPDLVVAFPGGRGTADMVRKARKAGIDVELVAENTPESARTCSLLQDSATKGGEGGV